MVRNFSDKQVPDDTLLRIIKAAKRAPTAGNSQGTSLIILNSPQQTKLYWAQTTTQEWRDNSHRATLMSAPLIIIPACDPTAYVKRYSEPDKKGAGLDSQDSWPTPYWLVDASFCAMSILLSCANEGLGACFMGIFRGLENLHTCFEIPEYIELLGAIAIGYPKVPDPKSKSLLRDSKSIEDFVHYGHWNN